MKWKNWCIRAGSSTPCLWYLCSTVLLFAQQNSWTWSSSRCWSAMTTSMCCTGTIRQQQQLVSVKITCFHLQIRFFLHTGESGLTQSLGAVVVGHFSIDGSVKEEHYNFKTAHNVIVLDEEPTDTQLPLSLFGDIIKKFSFVANTVVEALGTGKH